MLIAPKKISVWLKRYLQESKIYSFFYSNLGWGSGSGRENFSTPSKYNRCYMTCFRTSFFITRFTTARIITQQVVFVFDRFLFLFLFLLFLRSMRLSTRTVQWGCFYTSVGQPRALHVNVADCFRCFFFYYYFLFLFPSKQLMSEAGCGAFILNNDGVFHIPPQLLSCNDTARFWIRQRMMSVVERGNMLQMKAEDRHINH